MDLIADYANLCGIGREEALNEAVPWMLHCLLRHEASAARQSIMHARAVHAAVAPAMGCEGGTRLLQDFYAEQLQIMRRDPFSSPHDEASPTTGEIAFFKRIERSACLSDAC